jgi:hypothetical protein
MNACKLVEKGFGLWVCKGFYGKRKHIEKGGCGENLRYVLLSRVDYFWC